MKYLEEYLKIIIITIIVIIITSTLSYFNIISDKIGLSISYISLFISIFFGGLSLGTKKDKDGFLEGIKLGGIIALSFFIIRLIFTRKINLSKIIYYLIIVLISTIGSVIGINKKGRK